MSDTASEITQLRAALAASEARAVVSTSEAMIKHLKLVTAKLRRDHYGHSAERRTRGRDRRREGENHNHRRV